MPAGVTCRFWGLWSVLKPSKYYCLTANITTAWTFVSWIILALCLWDVCYPNSLSMFLEVPCIFPVVSILSVTRVLHISITSTSLCLCLLLSPYGSPEFPLWVVQSERCGYWLDGACWKRHQSRQVSWKVIWETIRLHAGRKEGSTCFVWRKEALDILHVEWKYSFGARRR